MFDNVFEGLPASLVWGVFTRALGAVYLIAFASFLPQIASIAGERGVFPVHLKLESIRRDFPAPRRYLYFPSLLWLRHDTRTLRALALLGALAAVAVIYGGPHSFWALLVCYVCLLSLDFAVRMYFPWDCMLFEAGFFALFLAPTLPLPELAAVSAPAPAIAWFYRLLLLRVVFGFGKFKFLGATKRDWAFLKGFFINQPLPTHLAWYAHRLPLWMHKVGLGCLFVIEILLIWLVVVPHPLGLVGGAAVVALMLAIQLSGNFGWFNILTIAVCIVLFDWHTPRQLLSAPGYTLQNVVVGVHTLGALMVLPWNSYFAHSWYYWPVLLEIRPRVLAWPIWFYRALYPLRWLHSYGVFPPMVMAPVRSVATFEVSDDGKSWRELEHRYAPTKERSPPVYVAPHHARYDQALIYETYGTNPYSLVDSVAGSGLPHDHGALATTDRVAQRVLEGHYLEGYVFKRGSLSQAPKPPALVRMRVHMMVPTTPAQRRRTGAWWERRVIGPHMPQTGLREDFWKRSLPEPELWHWDALVWRRRSRLRELMARARAGEDVTQAIVADTDELTTADVERFWNELLPAIDVADREAWERLPQTVAGLARRYRAEELHKLHRISGRLFCYLSTKLEPLYFDQRTLELPTYLHVAMLCHHIICEGRDAFEAVAADPSRAADFVPRMSLASGTYLLAVFRYRQVLHEARKIRLLDMVYVRESESNPASPRAQAERNVQNVALRLWGVAHWTPLLRERMTEARFDPDGFAERYPRFTVLESGAVVLADEGADDGEGTHEAADAQEGEVRTDHERL